MAAKSKSKRALGRSPAHADRDRRASAAPLPAARNWPSRTPNVLQPHSAAVQVNGARLRSPLPGQYTVIERVSVERHPLDARLSDENILDARMRDRPIIDYYIVETVLHEDNQVEATVRRDGQRWDAIPQVSAELHRQRRLLEQAREADHRAEKVLKKFGWPG